MMLHVQMYTMMIMAGSAIVLGFVFDGYRVTVNQLHMHRRILSLLDLIYWLAAAVFVYWMLYESNDGEIRAYVFIGLLVGTWLYFWLLSTIAVRFVIWLIQMVQAIVRFIVRCFGLFIVKPARALYRFIIIVLGLFVTFALVMARVGKYVGMPLWRLLRWAVRPLGGLYTLVVQYTRTAWRRIMRLFRR